MKNEIAPVQKNSLLNILLTVHAILTFAAAIVLIVAPEMVPGAAGIRLEPDAHLICYLLAATELSLAFLSWGGRKLTDAKSLRVIVTALIVFHSASGIPGNLCVSQRRGSHGLDKHRASSDRYFFVYFFRSG